MSILNVEHLTHGFGDRQIFDDVSSDFCPVNTSDWWAPTEKASLLL